MKNIIKSFLLSIAAISMFANCTQDNLSAPKGESLVFTATIANATRTSIDIDGTAGKVNWVAGDEILINGVAYVATPDPSDATKATFEKKNAADADAKDIFGEYYATYCCSFDPETGEGIIPATQEYTSANMLSAPMVAVSGSTSLSFLNICGLLEINIKGTKTVKNIEVSADNIGLSGKFTVLDGQSATIIDDSKKSVTLDCGDGIALSSEGTKFYVAVPAAEYTGLKVSIRTTDNNSWSTTAVRTASVEANQIYSIEFTPEFVGSLARYSNDGGATWSYTESLADAVNGIATTTAKADGKVELLKDCTIESQVQISGRKFTWNGNGHTVRFVGKYDEITDNKQGGIHIMSSSNVDFTDTKFVGPGTSSTATDRPFAVVASTASFGKDVTISDFKNSRPYGGAIWCNNQSVVYLKDNLKITNCHNAPTSSDYGGGALCSDGTIYVQDDVLISECSSTFSGGAILSNYNNATSKLTISGNARIEKCKAKNGGAVYLSTSKANITLSGNALIKDCEASTAGGGIGTNASAVIEMKGRARITGCKALGGNGGAIRDNYLGGSVTVTENAVIDNCSATVQGGAIQHCGTITISGNATIDGCHSDKIGGAIAVWQKATLEGNATIKNCSSDLGGAICDTTKTANYGVVIIKGSVKIDGCSASRGGGVYMASGAVGGSCTIADDATISNCTATSHGGGLFNSKGTVTLSGGTISDCSVSGSGGAVYNKGGEVNMSAGTISNCKASSNNGGAIYNPSTFNMSGGTISGCSAKYGGGIDNHGGAVSLTGGTITGCSASTWGGGIYNTASATTTIDGGKISACTGSYGAGISVYSGSVTLNSGSVSADKGNPIAKANNTANTCTININGGSVLSSETGGSAISFDVKGGTLNINGGTIEAKGPSAYAVYNTQGTVNINEGSTLHTAYRFGYVKAGSININGGLLDGYDGIYVVSSTDAETKLTIKGGEMKLSKSTSNCAWFYTNSASDKIITLDIQGGKFKCSGDVFTNTADLTAKGNGMPSGSVKKISGGLFYAYTDAMSTMAANAGCKFSAEKNADGYYSVIPK